MDSNLCECVLLAFLAYLFSSEFWVVGWLDWIFFSSHIVVCFIVVGGGENGDFSE